MKLSHEQIRDAAHAGLKAKLGDSWAGGGYNWRIVATFTDAVVVQRGDVPKLERYPLTVDLFGKVELGEPDPVAQEFAKLSEACGAVVLGPILEEGEKAAKPGSKWAVVAIASGVSKNRTFYPAEVLREAAPLYEGAKVFWNHKPTEAMRDPRDIAGFLSGARYALLESQGGGIGAVFATLNATDAGLRERLLEAHEAGNPDLFGLSHTAQAEGERVQLPKVGSVLRVKKIAAVESVDVVSFPSAGGRVMRLVAGLTSPVEVTEEEIVMFDRKLKLLRESHPALAARLSASPTEAEVDALLLEAAAPKAPPAPPAPAPTPDASKGMSAADRALLLEARVDRLMAGRTVPEGSREAFRVTLLEQAKLGAEPEALQGTLDRLIEATAKLAEPKPGASVGTVIEGGQDEVEKAMKALDGFFAGKDVDGVGRFTSIREAYVSITGDDRVTGLTAKAKGLERFNRFLEAEGLVLRESITSSTLANVLSSTMNRALVREYNAAGGAYADMGRGWLWSPRPATDFRDQQAVRFGGYGNLSAVNEGAAYNTLTSPDDEKATFAVTKRGGVESITFEMIRNDDVGVVRRIPQRMAFAARRTLYEFVHDFYATNPTIYDSVALFHSNHGSNLGSAALADSSWLAAYVAVQKQTERDSSKRLGLVLRHLMVPVDLEKTAYDLFVRSTNNDPIFLQARTAPHIHVITHLTDTNNWFACAGEDQAPQIEIAFLDGREEPEIFVADMPTGGSLFASDKIDYKIRHIYGGAVVDYRPFYGAIVT